MNKLACKKDRLKAAMLVVALVLAAPCCIAGLLRLETILGELGGFAQGGTPLSQTLKEGNALAHDFIDLSDYSLVRFDEATGICGFESSVSPEQTLSDIAAKLEEKAWTAELLESETSASFYKAEGTYQWVYVSCGCVQGATVVVCYLA